MKKYLLFFVLILMSSYYILEFTFIKTILYSIIMLITVILLNLFDNRKKKGRNLD